MRKFKVGDKVIIGCNKNLMHAFGLDDSLIGLVFEITNDNGDEYEIYNKSSGTWVAKDKHLKLEKTNWKMRLSK